jgi:hypothetical protein
MATLRPKKGVTILRSNSLFWRFAASSTSVGQSTLIDQRQKLKFHKYHHLKSRHCPIITYLLCGSVVCKRPTGSTLAKRFGSSLFRGQQEAKQTLLNISGSPEVSMPARHYAQQAHAYLIVQRLFRKDLRVLSVVSGLGSPQTPMHNIALQESFKNSTIVP